MIWIDLAAVAIAAFSVAFAVRADRRAGRAVKQANKIAESALRLDDERRHDDLAPEVPSEIEADVRESAQGHSFLIGEITVPRDYRVRAEAIAGSSTPRVHLDMVLRANRSYTFEIEKWPPGKTKPTTRELRIRFWPPQADVDPVPHWTCPCHRPTADGDGTGPGHWEWRVPVSYYDPVASIH